MDSSIDNFDDVDYGACNRFNYWMDCWSRLDSTNLDINWRIIDGVYWISLVTFDSESEEASEPPFDVVLLVRFVSKPCLLLTNDDGIEASGTCLNSSFYTNVTFQS